jgi:hypothetical protein
MSFARISIAAFAVVAALLLPGFAGAASCPAGSAVCQYTQDPPTGTGTTVKHKTVPLTSKGTTGLWSVGQKYRSILKNLATQSDYGAPVAMISLFEPSAGNNPDSSVGNSSVSGSLRAAIVSPGAGSENRLLGLLVVIVVITATPAVLGIAAARKRRA